MCFRFFAIVSRFHLTIGVFFLSIAISFLSTRSASGFLAKKNSHSFARMTAFRVF